MKRGPLTRKTRQVASSHGADLLGVVSAGDLPEHRERLEKVLPSARSVVVVAARHSLAAISSANNQVAQFDTIHAYQECARAAQQASRFLEAEGFPSVAVPAFIPIDMDEPDKGMRGEICWRRAAVRAGLGSYGENGLLVTREFGSAVRISGVLTAAELEADNPLAEDVCDHCGRCLEACPAGALSGQGRINKKLCGDVIFRYGLRYFARFVEDLARQPPAEVRERVRGPGFREMWQTFMTGNYYYCFKCQSQCPAEKIPRQAGQGGALRRRPALRA